MSLLMERKMSTRIIKTFYPLDDFENQNIPTGISGMQITGTIVARSGTELYTYYQIYSECFKIGFWKGEQPKRLTLDQFLEEIKDNSRRPEDESED